MSSSLRGVDYAIPILDPARFAGGYSAIPVDRSDPRFDEPLTRLESVGVAYESYYARSDGLNPPFRRRIGGSREDMWVRRSLAEKLRAVNERLHAFGAELFVLDGYRTVECQQGLWSFYYDEARRESPDASEDQRRRYARQFIRDPSRFDRNNLDDVVPPHHRGRGGPHAQRSGQRRAPGHGIPLRGGRGRQRHGLLRAPAVPRADRRG